MLFLLLLLACCTDFSRAYSSSSSPPLLSQHFADWKASRHSPGPPPLLLRAPTPTYTLPTSTPPPSTLDSDQQEQDKVVPAGGTSKTLVIGAALAVPVAAFGAAGVLATTWRKRHHELNERRNLVRNVGELDDDYSDGGDFSDDAGFESKFEVGSDTALWSQQADVSAF